jgi:SAM-dependent methyltransferase
MTITAWLRWDVVRTLLPAAASTVLDIGAGTGVYGQMLAERYVYLGLEPDETSYSAARRRIGDRGDVRRWGFEDLERGRRFDLVCAFEVLEHMEHDDAALARWAEFVEPGGWLLLSVPKGSTRYGAGNENVGDLRRYDELDLRHRLHAIGLDSLVVRSYGTPYGNIQESIQNVILDRKRLTEPMRQRTLASARSMQPPGLFAWAVAGAAYPFRLLQRPFSYIGIGTGIIIRGRRAPLQSRAFSSPPE